MNRLSATEEQEHLALMDWVRLHERRYPALRLLLHIPNGGSRHILEAAKFKRLGVRPGVPDLFLAYPHAGFHGWWCEMKAKTGRISKEQQWWLRELTTAGYYTCVAYGWDSARTHLLHYLKIGERHD